MKIYKLKLRTQNFIQYHLVPCLIVAIILSVHAFVYSHFYMLVQTIGLDEPATLSLSSIVGRQNWRDAISLNKYYGFGLTVFLQPVFCFDFDPIVSYRIMQFISSILYAFSALICFSLMNQLAEIKTRKDEIFAAFISIASVFIPLKFPSILNEHMLILLNWIVVWLLVKVFDGKHRIQYTVILITVLSYALVVHERAITLWAGAIMAVICISLLSHSFPLRYLFSSIPAAIGCMGAKRLTTVVKHSFWLPGHETNTVDGTLSTLLTKISYLSFRTNWIFPLVTMFSQFFVMTLVTGNLFLSVVLCSICTICSALWKRNSLDHLDSKISIISVYMLTCVVLTIVIQAITWMPDYRELDPAIKAYEVFGKRAKLYLRYFCCYCGPAVMLFGVFWLKRSHLLKRVYLISSFTYIVMSALELRYVSRWYADYSLKSSPVYMTFYPFVFWSQETNLTSSVFLSAILIVLIVAVIIGLFLFFDKKTIASIIIAGFLIFQYVTVGVDIYGESSQTIYDANYPVYQVVSSIDDQIGPTIYMPEMTSKDIRLQLYLKDYSLSNRSPDNLASDTLVIIEPLTSDINQTYLSFDMNTVEAGAYRLYLGCGIELNDSK